MDGNENEHRDALAPQGPSLEERRLLLAKELRAVREQSGLTLAALAQSTRINPSYLEALERGDFAALPGEVFARGFVKNACKAMGKDSTPLLKRLDDCYARGEPEKPCLKIEIKNKPGRYRSSPKATMKQAVAKLQLPKASWTKLRWPAVGVVGLLVVFGIVRAVPWSKIGAAFKSAPETASAPETPKAETPVAATAAVEPTPALTPAQEPSAPAAATASTAPASAAATATPSAQPAPAAASDSAQAPAAPVANEATRAAQPEALALGKDPAVTGEQLLELEVTAPVKVRMGIDGAANATAELAPQTYRYTFKDKAEILVYDAAAVQIRFNGRSLGSLGNKGRVRRLSFQAQPPEAGKASEKKL